MFQFHYKNAHNSLSRFYNSIWLMRWVVFAVFSIIWYKYPNTLYVFFAGVNLAMVILTVVCRKSFRFAFYWILTEELLITLWHGSALVLFVDYYKAQNLSKFVVALLTNIMFWSYLITVIIEFYLLMAGAARNTGYFN
jgi:hypothetical protein